MTEARLFVWVMLIAFATFTFLAMTHAVGVW
jgi:hypothetical protein